MPSAPFVPPSTSKKPIAPISSNAFAFSLSTPSKPTSTRPRQERTPRQSLSRDIKPDTSELARRPGPSEASGSRTATLRLSETPLRTVKQEADQTPTSRRAAVRLGDLSTPFLTPAPPASERKGKRKLNEALNGDSPFSAKPPLEERQPGKVLRGVTDLQDGVRFDGLQEFSEVDRVKAEEEEGVGVSPRRTKGMSKWGKTPASLSKQLTDLLSAQTSAILLFYTSLQHTFAPARPVPRSSTRPGIPQPNFPIPVIKVEGGTSVLSHIRTAPLRLQLISPQRGRTQYAHIWLCKVLLWPPEAPMFDHRGNEIPSTRKRPNEVLCVFQNLSAECPRIGLDPKLLATRYEEGMGEEGRKWEVGVWGPWSERDMVDEVTSSSRVEELEVMEDKEDQRSLDWPEDGEEGDRQTESDGEAANDTSDGDGSGAQKRREKDTDPGEKKMTKVLFASRYLIAER